MISNQLDSFILDKDKTYWKAELSDGQIVYQDDHREGYAQPISWYRLKSYCESNNLFVRKMWLVFRSHTEYCGESNKGFFFTFAIKAAPLQEPEHMYTCGPIIGDEIHVTVWKVPEIIAIESSSRPIIGNEEKIICINHLSTDTNAQISTT